MSEPKLALILATDTYSTIRPVVDRWRRQAMRKEVELILVAPSTSAVSEAMAHRNEFANIQIVVDPMTDLSHARAKGIRAATAPLVFVGETHSYPQAGFAEALVAGFSGPWSSVTPAFGNANPKGVLSWAGFLSDYARWADGLPAGEIAEAPLYNAAYQKTVLLQLGDRLAPALSHGDELWLTLRAAGRRVYFQPAARLDHVNVSRPWHWVRERFLAGMLIASHRARRWSLARRLAYIPGSLLIPIVLTWRVVPGIWSTVRKKRLPLATIPMIVIGMIIKSAGEMAGYAGLSSDAAERGMHEYEVHKLAYIGRGQL